MTSDFSQTTAAAVLAQTRGFNPPGTLLTEPQANAALFIAACHYMALTGTCVAPGYFLVSEIGPVLPDAVLNLQSMSNDLWGEVLSVAAARCYGNDVSQLLASNSAWVGAAGKGLGEKIDWNQMKVAGMAYCRFARGLGALSEFSAPDHPLWLA